MQPRSSGIEAAAAEYLRTNDNSLVAIAETRK